jgi:hypothetical protein|uniref:Lipoprotein n=1 Tax=Siphoviridae sp. ctuy39 TaxID=2825719 RepID=A0A8S5VEF6_9CAUD|nr:MAG TPA: protein of unknown function (DUF4969) [Siphoviridae sp. ctuy39]
MKKKIVALMLVGCLAMSITACGGEKDTVKKETTEQSNDDIKEEKGSLSEYVGKPLSELMSKVDELGYTATYLADGVDFTDFIDAMKDDYLTGDIKEDAKNKTVEVTLKLIANEEAEKIKTSLNEKFPEGDAWVIAENYGQEKFGDGFDLNFLMGKIDASAEDENTWFLKAECSLDGTDMTCEAKITGTKDAPKVISFDIY